MKKRLVKRGDPKEENICRSRNKLVELTKDYHRERGSEKGAGNM